MNSMDQIETIRPGELRKSVSPRRPRRRRKDVLIFDPRKCTGCRTCEVVCSHAHTESISPSRAGISLIHLEGEGKNFCVFCQHCKDPLCVKACPAGAISQNPDGRVLLDEGLCIACRLCIMACPEGAPLEDIEARTIRKCDLCGEDRPLCEKHCPSGALTYQQGKRPGWIRFPRVLVQVVSFLLFVVILVGSFCSLAVGKISLSCPTGVLQGIAATGTVVLVTVLSTLILIGLSLFLGRVFCGWLCPMGTLLDLFDRFIPHFGFPLFLRNRWSKHSVLAASLVGSSVVGLQVFCTICPIGTICRSTGYKQFFQGYELAIVPAVAALNLGEKRSWCRYLCPVGALFSLFTWLGLVDIQIGAERCKKFSCMECADRCPTGIIDHEALREGISPRLPMNECIMCLRCVDECPYGAAKIRFRWARLPGYLWRLKLHPAEGK